MKRIDCPCGCGAYRFESETTAEQLREAAHDALQKREESFERCDTDGFVTQWAHGLTAAEQSEKARITENGGRSDFPGLYEGDRRVKAHIIETQFGLSWKLHDSETALIAERGKPFLPTGEHSRVLKALGLAERRELDYAWARLTGKGYGLSGTAWVATYRTGCKWGSDAILLDNPSETK